MNEILKEIFTKHEAVCVFVDPMSTKDLQEELFEQGFRWGTGETDVLYRTCPLLILYKKEEQYFIWHAYKEEVNEYVKRVPEIDINFLLSILKT